VNTAGQHSLVVSARGCVIRSTRLLGADGTGLRIETSGNDIVRNRVLDSGAFDLLDLGGADANSFRANRFGTVAPAP
jgi:hypothetical protein